MSVSTQRVWVLRLGLPENRHSRGRLDPGTKLFHQSTIRLRRQSTCPPIGNVPPGIERTEVQACGHVARLQVEVDAERREHAATYLVHGRIIAEEGQMPGSGTGRHAGGDRSKKPAGPFAGEPVEMRGVRGLQRSVTAFGPGDIAQAVKHSQQDLRIGVVYE